MQIFLKKNKKNFNAKIKVKLGFARDKQILDIGTGRCPPTLSKFF